MLTEAQAWDVLAAVPDPEIPVISVTELGIVREVLARERGLHVVVTPTYSGCPATEVISQSIRDALVAAGAGEVSIEMRLAPAWTTDWITEPAKEKLRAYGIAPPGPAQSDVLVTIARRQAVTCPFCGSTNTRHTSEFGSTSCKALHVCSDCTQPFEEFKAH